MQTAIRESVYQPLNHEKRQIRLLRFQGDSQSWKAEDLLSFDIEVVSLSDEPHVSYSAISYAWGEGSRASELILNGTKIAVPRSAEQTLRGILNSLHLAGLDAFWPIWIDAVCIRQSDLPEKSKQVALMKDIYASAEAVIVWFGEEDEATGPAFQTLKVLSIDCSKWTDGGPDVQKNDLLPPKEKRVLPYWSHAAPEECDWDAFNAYLRARWFFRLWIIQEVSNAQSVHCFMGSYYISWEDLSRAIQWTWHRQFQEVDSKEDRVNLLFVKVLIQGWTDRPKQASLDQLLLLNIHSDASNPWDRVYALLGLQDQPEATIMTDYERPLVEAYAEATFFAIIRSQNLYVLSLALVRHRLGWRLDDDWPSWIPRYDRLKGANEIATFSKAAGCNASDGMPAECSRLADGRILQVKGIRVGRVVCVLDLSQLVDEDEDADESLNEDDEDDEDEVAEYQRLGQVWFPQPQTTDHAKQTLDQIRALTAALEGQQDAEFRLWFKTCLYKDLAALISKAIQHSPSCDILGSEPSIDGASEGNAWDFLGELQAYIDTLGLSSIVLLDDGRFGFCVGDVQVNDEICVLSGGDLLFVLRRAEQGRRLCAYSYVPGAVKGELVRRLRDDGGLEGQSQTFDVV